MRIILLAATLALASCGPTTATSTATSSVAISPPCAATATHAWDAGAAGALTVSAMAVSSDCASAQVQLTITNAQNTTLYQQAYPAEQVMVLAGATTAAELQTKVTEWVDNAEYGDSGDLPDWPRGAEQPVRGEFPFYVAEGVTRESYLATRAAKAPMVCFVQGMESQACLVLRDGALVDLGAQSFPG